MCVEILVAFTIQKVCLGDEKSVEGRKGMASCWRSFQISLFGAGSRHRSLQGLAAFFLELLRHGSHRSKPSSPTARRSRSWLLIDYCEGLNAGRSMEAMICAMIKEPMGQSTVERVIYGDNAAAIAVAQGTGTSSWRTRIFEYVPHF